MINRSEIAIYLSGFSILILAFTFLGMIHHSLLAPFLVVIWPISIGFLINYYKIPASDSNVSRAVIYAKWKTGGKRPPVIGHAGASFDAPANTLEAIREAAKNGADGVEIDVHITKDNIGILIHDGRVDGTTDGSGNVIDLTYEEIQQLDASAKSAYRNKYKGAKVPTLEQGIQECLKLDLVMYIDVKSTDSKTISLILEMFKKYKLHSRAIVSAFNPFLLYSLKCEDAEIITVQLMRPYLTSYDGIMSSAKPRFNSTFQLYNAILLDKILEWSINTWLCHITGVSAVSLHHSCLSPYLIDEWRSNGFDVIAWTVNDKVEKSVFLQENVPIITDSIK